MVSSDAFDLSIVIVNWNTREYLLGALESIVKQMGEINVEVIVVDNNSSDHSAEAVRERFPDVELIANKTNTGYAEGNNQGLVRSSGTYVLLLNPDVILPDHSLKTAFEWMEARSDVGALGVRLVNPDGSVQRSVRGFPNPFAVLCEATGLSRMFPKSHLFGAYRMTYFTYQTEAEVDQPMGTFLLISRRTLEQVGLLDEQFTIFFNEVDWCYRAKKLGWKIVFAPLFDVIHYGGGSTRQVKPKMAWESRRGLLDFYKKHYPSPLFAPIYWLAVIGSWLQAKVISSRRSNEIEK